MRAAGLIFTRKEMIMKKFLPDSKEQEHQLLNAIYALLCCNVFIGIMWLLGIAP